MDLPNAATQGGGVFLALGTWKLLTLVWRRYVSAEEKHAKARQDEVARLHEQLISERAEASRRLDDAHQALHKIQAQRVRDERLLTKASIAQGETSEALLQLLNMLTRDLPGLSAEIVKLRELLAAQQTPGDTERTVQSAHQHGGDR